MSHEQSETIQLPGGKWANVYGRNTPKAGQRLPNDVEYGSVGEAEAAAQARSESYGMKPVTDPELLRQLEASEPAAPAGLKPVTDPSILAQLEAGEEPAPERSVVEQAGRQLGLTARAGAKGVAALPALLADIPRNLYATYLQGKRAIQGEGLSSFFKPVDASDFPVPSQSQAVDAALTDVGLPEPENATERVAQDVTSGMAGAGGMVGLGRGMAGAGNALMKRIGQLLGTAPGLQVASGATGPGAAGVTREAGGGTGTQLAAGLAGATVPSLPTVARATVRGMFRGGEAGRQQVASNIDTFEKAGAGTPTVGQATQGRVARAVESGLAKVPGGAGRIAAKAEAEAAGLGTKVDDMATTITARSGAAPAGRQIKGGIEQFVDDFKVSSGKLYDKLDQHIPQSARVDVSNTREALDKLNAGIPGAPNVSKFFKNARISGIKTALKADTETTAGVFDALPVWQKQVLEQLPDVERTAMLNGLIDGHLPYQALKKLRTLVGNEISNSTIASDVPRSKWNALYAALSKDMGSAARAAGPQAEQAFVRASNHYKFGMKRLDDVLGPVLKSGDPEDIFKATVAGTKEGATTLQGVMKSLPMESRKVVTSTMLRRLGQALPGKQDELGEVFSSETFLTNWNKLHPASKRALFAPMERGMRDDLDRIAQVASNMREGSKVFANPSGTAPATAGYMTAGGFVVSLLTGQLGTAAAIGGGVGFANASARLMTNPKFVHWLAESTRKPTEQLPAQLNLLFQQSMNLTGDERREMRNFIKQTREAAATQRTGPAQ